MEFDSAHISYGMSLHQYESLFFGIVSFSLIFVINVMCIKGDLIHLCMSAAIHT